MSFRTYVRNLKVLNLSKSRLLPAVEVTHNVGTVPRTVRNINAARLGKRALRYMNINCDTVSIVGKNAIITFIGVRKFNDF